MVRSLHCRAFLLLLTLSQIGVSHSGLTDQRNFYEINVASLPNQNTTFMSLVEHEDMCGTHDPVVHLGVEGALSARDCMGLAFFLRESLFSQLARQRVQEGDMGGNEVLGQDESRSSAVSLVYAESGSLLGLSAHIIASTALLLGVPVTVYAHDLFDSGQSEQENESWEPLLQRSISSSSKLQTFYNGVKRNSRQRVIIPIQGDY